MAPMVEDADLCQPLEQLQQGPFAQPRRMILQGSTWGQPTVIQLHFSW